MTHSGLMVGHSSKRFVVLQQPEITSLIAKAVSRSSVVTFESEKGCYATHLFPKKGSSEEGVSEHCRNWPFILSKRIDKADRL